MFLAKTLRKQGKTKVSLILLGLISLALLFPHAQELVMAATRDDLVKRKAELDRQQRELQGTLGELAKNTASLKNEITFYDTQIRATELAIQAQETQIEDTNLQIAELETQIAKRSQEIAANKQVLAELIRELYQLGENSAVTLGLGSGNFSDFMDQLQYGESMQEKVNAVLENIKEVKAKLEAQQADLELKAKQLEQLREHTQQTQNALGGQKRNKQTLLDATRGKEANYQKMLAASQKEEANIDKEIEELNRRAQTSGKGGGIKPAKGILAWPMDGVLTQRYGNTGFTDLGYSFHNGIDVAAPAGTPIYAPRDGTVLQCSSDATAYGNWCTMKITIPSGQQIIALFAHMSSYKVRAGQALKLGDLIGYEGNTGNTTRLLYGPKRGFHHHFTVCDANGYQVVPGSNQKIYGPYYIPTCYTYDPLKFLQ